MAGLDFAAWEFFRALIKRNHPERMTSLVHAHTLLPCPLQCPHSHASRGSVRQGCRWRSPRQRQILCVCQQAKCRLRAFLAFPPLLVQYCCGCISLGVSFPPELQRQKLTLGGKEEGVLPGHTPPILCRWEELFPAWAFVPSVRLSPLWGGPHRRELCRVAVFCRGRISPYYFLTPSAPQTLPKVEPQIFPLWSSGWPREPKVGSGTHVGYLMMALIAQRSHILLCCFLVRPC